MSKIQRIFSPHEKIAPEDILFDSFNQESDLLGKTSVMTMSQAKEHFEYALIKRRFEMFDKDPRKTADSLGILPNNIYRFLKKYSIDFNEGT